MSESAPSTIGFFGAHELRLDGDRLTMPKKLKQTLDEHYPQDNGATAVVAWCDTEPEADIESSWRVRILPATNYKILQQALKEETRHVLHQQKNYMEFLDYFTEDQKIESPPRVKIPPHIRDKCGIDRDVTLVGRYKYMELWDRTRWRERHSKQMEQLPQILQDISANCQIIDPF